MTSHGVVYDGLRWLFRDYALDDRISMTGDIARIERHFADASARYGIDLSPSEETIGHVGYNLLRFHRADLAVAAFRRNVALHPTSPNAYDSLADGLEAAGHGAEALAVRERAVALATEQRDLRLADYTASRNRLRNQLAAPARP